MNLSWTPVLAATACMLFSCICSDSNVRLLEIEKHTVGAEVSAASKSFVHIESAVELTLSNCSQPGECVEQTETIYASLGSGMTIKRKGKIYVLTAGHVCAPQLYDPYLSTMSYIGTIKNVLVGHGYFGNKAEFEILTIDIDRDICILTPKSIWPLPGLPLAKKLPKQGSKLFMVAAPFGIFQSGLVLTFEGYLGGIDSTGDILVSIPTRPGASGAAILDRQNRVVGIIHSAYANMENIGIGTPVEDVHRLFEALEQ